MAQLIEPIDILERIFRRHMVDKEFLVCFGYHADLVL